MAALLASYPYNDLRRYRIINKEKQTAFIFHLVRKSLSGGGAAMVAAEGEEIRGIAALRPLSWDSSIFGIPMGQIPLFVHGTRWKGSRETIEALLDSLVRSCRERGMKHLNIRVDADDLALVQVLESRRFYLVDAIVTYIFLPKRHELGHVKHLFKTRLYHPGDREGVLHVARESYKNYLGRYHADPHLPLDACARFYEYWAEQLLDGGIAERIIVAERGGRVVGFLGYKMNSDILESTGVKVVGGGLGGCLPEGIGAYGAILDKAMREGMHRYDAQDFETQINNITIVRLYQKLNFEYARAKYTFHLSDILKL